MGDVLPRNFLWEEKLYCFTWGTNDNTMSRRKEGGSFINAFSSNLKMVVLKVFPNVYGIFT